METDTSSPPSLSLARCLDARRPVVPATMYDVWYMDVADLADELIVNSESRCPVCRDDVIPFPGPPAPESTFRVSTCVADYFNTKIHASRTSRPHLPLEY